MSTTRASGGGATSAPTLSIIPLRMTIVPFAMVPFATVSMRALVRAQVSFWARAVAGGASKNALSAAGRSTRTARGGGGWGMQRLRTAVGWGGGLVEGQASYPSSHGSGTMTGRSSRKRGTTAADTGARQDASPPLADLLSPRTVKSLTDPKSFERGEQYAREGRVVSLTQYRGEVLAVVR